ncbi:MAG: hypothetical protein AB3N20_02370 [Rhizobiaceae bacterium]
MSDRTGKASESASPTSWAWLFFILAGLLIVIIDAWDGQLYYGDLDDRMRALQVRDLLQSRAFFDLELGFVALPETYQSHYSRLVDFPYFAIASLSEIFVTQSSALAIAHLIWPPFMLLFFMALAIYAARRIAGRQLQLGELLVMALLMALAVLEFSPGRIDHHNFQLLLMMAMTAGLAAGTRIGGWMSGIAAAVSIAIGLECLPYIAAGLGILALAATFNPGRHIDQLTATGAGFALAAIPAGYLSLGSNGLFAGSCDAIGAPWVLAIVSSGTILALVPLLWPLPPFRQGSSGLTARLLSLALPALAAVAVVVWMFPECAGDPYGNVQGIARELWFDRIRQEKPLTAVFTEGSIAVAALCGIYSFVVIAGGVFAIDRARLGDTRPLIVFAVAVASLALFFFLFRSVRFMAVFVPLFVPAALDLRQRAFPAGGKGERAAQIWLVAAALVPVTLIGSVFMVSRAEEKPLSVFDQMLVDDCKGQDISLLGRVDGGNVLASYAMSYRVAEEFPRHRIGAVPLHRAAPAISRLLTAYTETDAAERNRALSAYDYLAVCARNLGVDDIDSTPLFAALIEGETVAGLEPVEPSQDTAFRLFRINRAALR